jgi:predicted extracellular nuclease
MISVRRQLLAFLTLAVLLTTGLLLKSVQLVPTVEAVSNTIVISQIYGGGGNAGSTYTHDFIELFNRGNTTVDVTGWSVQYASATGTSWQVTNLSGMIAPGKYYLVQEAQGAGGTTPLPTPDATGTIAMSATAGKVALVNSTTALTGSCPTGAQIIDLIGFGATANCFEGTASAPAPSNTTGDLRGGGGCTETDQNATDFTAVAPTPRNSASPAATCGGPTPPTGVGAANPGSVVVGGTTLLTVTVTPGTMPPSTGITVTGNLTSIGGSAMQMFFDDGTNGDVMPLDNIFSYQATVAIGTPTGPKTLPFTVADAQMRSSTGNISLTVTGPPVSIHDIQGNGSSSPLMGQLVTTSGIVTGLKSNGFFIQEPSPDADPNTSEGVFVFTSSAPPAGAAIGNNVTVLGTVAEFIPAAEPNSPPLTELTTPTVSVNSTGNSLPAPVTITAADTTPNNLENLEKFEAMRVHVAQLIVVGPTQGNIDENDALVTSNGLFFGVLPGVPRPFREPGIEVTLNLPAGAPANVPRFDTNPERLRIDSDAQPGAAILDVTAGATVSNIVGPLDYGFTTWTILPDAATPPTVSNQASARPVSPATFNELSISSFNMQRFYNNVDDAGGDVVLTTQAFNNRLNKASLAIRNVMRTPDVIGVVEMENLATLQAVATKVNNDAVAAGQPNPNYQAYLVEGNDVGLIDVGFLVKSTRVTVVDVTQAELAGCMQTAATCYNFINPNTGMAELLNDRPPLILRATIPSPGSAPLPFTVIVNHSRSLSGIDSTAVNGTGTEGGRIRFKRRAQAEFLANLIQARQVADPNENLAVVGDFNAFPFNDGYVDVEGTIAGTPTPANQVVLASSDLVNPDLTNLIDLLPPTERYSFTFDGNAQALDYILVNNNLRARLTRHAYARNNGDFPQKYYEDANRPERISDHDMPVAYFRLAVRNKAADFDGDGQADLSVFRPSDLRWYILKSSDNTLLVQSSVTVPSKLVPGDYDGDGKTEAAGFQNGQWSYRQSSDNGFRLRFFGNGTDIPVPGDYDNDGKTDLAVFRPSEGAWYVERSSDNVVTSQAFGSNGDKPVPGDYDNDGKTDFAVYRPSQGAWYVSNSSGTFSSMFFGLPSDLPVQSDYDGDGRTDFAVYRPSEGVWYIQRSTNGFQAVQFGLATDKLVPADYNGDGKSDIAVFRDGIWYIRESSFTDRGVDNRAELAGGGQWGLPGDKPVPAAYVPEH